LSISKVIKKLKKKHPQLTVNQLESILNIFLTTIDTALISKKNVELRSLGTFFIKQLKERKNARNPKTGELIYVPSKNKVRFRASKKLKEFINK
jgi:integration host factor subunit beta